MQILTKSLLFGSVLFTSTQAAGQGTMYACESGRQFYNVNIGTGAKTLLGNISAGNNITGSLTFDCATQTTYLSSTGGLAGQPRNLHTLNVSTRQTTIVGPYGDTAIIMHAIEIDPRTGLLYGVSIHNHGLYSISRTNGAATLIGLTGIAIGATTFNALGFDSDNGIMYMINTGTDSLYRVNLGNGNATLVGPLNGPIGCGGMTYNIDNHTMYMVDNDGDILYTVNLSTGAATAVGSTGVGNLIGLVYVTPTCPPPPNCNADFNVDGVVDFFDYLDFVDAFSSNLPGADFNEDGIIDFFDYLDFVDAFSLGC